MNVKQSLNDSVEIVTQGMKLAIATGESLSSVTDALSRTMVAFSLSADKAKEIISQFYSTAIQTPSSVDQISQALTNSSSAFATLINNTEKSGEGLKQYQSDLLELNVAMVGSLSEVGWIY